VLGGESVVGVVHLEKQGGGGGGGGDGGSSLPGHPLLPVNSSKIGNRSDEAKVVGVVDPRRGVRLRYDGGGGVNVVGVGDVSLGGDKSKLGSNTCHEGTGLGFVKQFLSLSLIHHH